MTLGSDWGLLCFVMAMAAGKRGKGRVPVEMENGRYH